MNEAHVLTPFTHQIEHRGSEAFWRHARAVTHSDETLVDANKVGVPVQLALTLGGLLVALVVGYYTGQAQWSKEMAGLRSDVRDGFTMLQGAREVDSIRIDVIRRDLDEAMRQLKLQGIKIGEDHDDLIVMKGRR